MIKENIRMVLNSNKEIFLFEVLKNNRLSYSIYDSSLQFMEHKVLYDKDIECYDLYVDESDALHLVSLSSSGELIYYKYLENKWSSGVVGKFDLKSNVYNQIEILFIKDKLHIIYNYSNLINSNVWTIQHVIYSDKVEAKHNVIRYISTKNPENFIIDVDSKGTIHLIYNTNVKKTEIFHCFYNPFTNAWSSKSNKISKENKNNIFPCLLIDTKDNVHVLWLEGQENKFYIKYLKMNSKGKEKYIWKTVKLDNINVSKYTPVLFQEDNKIKLLFVSNSSINLIESNDYGNSWSEIKNSTELSKDITIVKTKSNINNTNSKINYSYCKLNDNIKFYYLDIYKELSNTAKETIEVHEVQEKNQDISNKNVNVDSIILQELSEKLDSIIVNENYMEELVTKILINQENIDIKLDKIYKSINPNKKTILEKILNSSN